MTDVTHKIYQYDPHAHVKIWLSMKPDNFMNTENQMRLITMRENNPADSISLVYDSSLLNEQAINSLNLFCAEHRITPVDAHQFATNLNSEHEHTLYELYRDEITHFNEGGNPALASDILRWLSPVYTRGTYTDFDVPVDTAKLPKKMDVQAPLLLNIGSLRIRNKDIILSNNDYIAIADPLAAQNDINKIQQGMIDVLRHYTTDFIEKTAEEFGKNSFLNKYFINFMKNRSESIYIARSKNIFSGGKEPSSRQLRQYINEIMNDSEQFINFNKISDQETRESVLLRLRNELKSQIGFFKWFFFRNEYKEINAALQKTDSQLLDYLMKKERTLYLKSIVVCTTGPIAIAKFLFNNYVFHSNDFNHTVQPYSFNHYGLKKAFQSLNSIPMSTSLWGMMTFLGTEDGTLNDSSWLETGAQLQKTRGEILQNQKRTLQHELPEILDTAKKSIEEHIKQLQSRSTGFWGLFFSQRKLNKIEALQQISACFKHDHFDTNQFKTALNTIKANKKSVYAGLFSNHTQHLIETLKQNCTKAIVFGLTTNRAITIKKKSNPHSDSSLPAASSTENKLKPIHEQGLSFFKQNKKSDHHAPTSQTEERQFTID
ncbi:glycosyltransferase family 88 protein [Legionella worsleiensis]|uniref:Putative glucosyltransferase Lgt1 n=1 Tax=Legionella worsleiensis TaxID=45076 RepID=A0A0W1AFQ3_9GAMM|nr:glycosyltransferase family 88 protein [Legionella worsleiensis]KTD80199.1 putative glucosyltransferase Lgt1 [Legionella worsleiensis]STY31750.1 putative glucosyltransferase Lgt1 [Legionella worsleiensis]